MRRIYSRFGTFENYLVTLRYGAVRIRQKSASSMQGFDPRAEEAVMNDINIFASADAPGRRGVLAALRDTLEAWEGRARFRWELRRMAEANPHLIDDIGLTRRQVEAEIAKPFWQV
jgi:uncharacterized protein YjiS (DUF1127 family)